MGVTALNVYAGLFGPLLITDQRERALQISGVMPAGKFDVPLVLKDYWSDKHWPRRRGSDASDRRAAALHCRARSLISLFGPLLGAALLSIAHCAAALRRADPSLKSTAR